jgi:hypothetical protein
MFLGLSTVVFTAVLFFCCAGDTGAQPLFEEVAVQMGINHNGNCGTPFWYDYDNDGEQDLLHSYRFGGQTIIYRNDGDHFAENPA